MSAEKLPHELLKHIEYLLDAGDSDALSSLLAERHPADIGEVLGRLSHSERRRVFELMEDERAGEVLEELDTAVVADFASDIPAGDLSDIIESMPPEEAVDVLDELPEDQAGHVLEEMEPTELRDVQEYLQYPEDTAGGHMHAVVASLPEDATAAKAIEALREMPLEGETFYVYVVDRDQHLVGTVSLKRLVTAGPDTFLKDICDRDVVKLRVYADQEEMASVFDKYDLISVPVVDDNDKLLGRVLAEDVIDVIREEATEDVYRMAGIDHDEVESWSPLRVAGARLPWLLICLGGTMVSALLMEAFEFVRTEVIALVMFSPAIAAMSGNMGLQTSAVAIRGIATGRLDRTNPLQYLFKEIGSTLLVALACGMLVGSVAWLWVGTAGFGAVVGFAMFAAMSSAAMLGALLPLSLRNFGIDPALASGPLLTTINDGLGLLIYFGMAALILLR